VPGFEAERFGSHGKVIVLDSDRVFVGTLNLDPRSMFLNTEMGLLIDSPQLNAAVREALAPNFSLDNSWQLQLNEQGRIRWHSHDGILDRQPAGSFTRRIKDFFIGLLPIDSEM
jgi:putative cardiolipin synthase